MMPSWTRPARTLLLVPTLLASGSDRIMPTEAPVLRDRLLFETQGGIGVIAPDGSRRGVLPIGGDLELARDPGLSPDGQRVAFTGSGALRGIYLRDQDGSNLTSVGQSCGPDCEDRGPRWAPRGRCRHAPSLVVG